MTGLQVLNDLALQADILKHPNFPVHLMAKHNFRDKTANDLTKSIFHFLSLKSHYVTRINTQGQYQQKLKRFTRSTTKLGTADIHAVVNGYHLSVEVKIGKDRLSEHQKRTREEIEKAGGLYFVATDFESFYQYYLTIPKPKRQRSIV